MGIHQKIAPKIALLSHQSWDATFAAEMGALGQSELWIPESAGQVFEQWDQVKALFVDVVSPDRVREFEIERIQHQAKLQREFHSDKIHFISDKDLAQNRDLIFFESFSNFFVRPAERLGFEAELYHQMIDARSRGALANPLSFLAPNAHEQVIELAHTADKLDCCEALRSYLFTANVPAREVNVIANCADELIMNAMFDAPSDFYGKPLYDRMERSRERELPLNERVLFKMGFDGYTFCMSVTDQFGSAQRESILNHLSRDFRSQEYHVDQGKAGAGLGLSFIHYSGGSLIFETIAGVSTTVTLISRVFDTYRDFKSQFRFLSVVKHGSY